MINADMPQSYTQCEEFEAGAISLQSCRAELTFDPLCPSLSWTSQKADRIGLSLSRKKKTIPSVYDTCLFSRVKLLPLGSKYIYRMVYLVAITWHRRRCDPCVCASPCVPPGRRRRLAFLFCRLFENLYISKTRTSLLVQRVLSGRHVKLIDQKLLV